MLLKQEDQSSANSDGLGFLLKRIHEMLLGIALVIELHTILSKEAQFQKDQHGAINHTDLKRIMTLAHEQCSILIQAEDNTLDSSNTLRSGAWKYLNSHIIRLIHSSNTWFPNSMQQKRVYALEPATIAELLLVDIYNEAASPNPGSGVAWNEPLFLMPPWA
ncbi:hypothetical protein VP01_209g2 [Puccinia sorghi]|uniref:Uncharacterized protein n=1 Tax=Puccinia sorghi TaxID=27349 RepID=A0A0L6VAT8_9BASI|nr:hypothetical protein VP01_209g2 [Puccinia sorghi]